MIAVITRARLRIRIYVLVGGKIIPASDPVAFGHDVYARGQLALAYIRRKIKMRNDRR